MIVWVKLPGRAQLRDHWRGYVDGERAFYLKKNKGVVYLNDLRAETFSKHTTVEAAMRAANINLKQAA